MSVPTTPPPDHSVKVTHLVFGLLFLGVAGVWALVSGGVITAGRLTYLGPGVLILAGVVGLAASMASSRNRHARDLSTPDLSTPDLSTPDPTQHDTTEEIR